MGMALERLPAADQPVDPADRNRAIAFFVGKIVSESHPVTFDGNGELFPVFADLSQRRRIIDRNDVPSGWWLPLPVLEKFQAWDKNTYHDLGRRLDPAYEFMLKAWAYSTELAEPFKVSFHAFDPQRPKGNNPPEGGLCLPHVGLLSVDGKHDVEYWCAMSSQRPLEIGLPLVAARLQRALGTPREQHIFPTLSQLDRHLVTFPEELVCEIPSGRMHLIPSPEHPNGMDTIHLVPESIEPKV